MQKNYLFLILILAFHFSSAQTDLTGTHVNTIATDSNIIMYSRASLMPVAEQKHSS